MFRMFTVFVLFFLSVFICDAKQVLFEIKRTNSDTQFKYTWKNSNEVKTSFNFSLPNVTILKAPSTKKAFNQRAAQQHVRVELLKYVQTIDPKKATFKIIARNNELRVRVKSRYPDLLRKYSDDIEQRRQIIYDNYLNDQYYIHFITERRQRAIKPDHVRFANESVIAMSNIVDAIDRQLGVATKKEFVNFVINWIQNIPYDRLKNRTSSNGGGFLSPIDLLLSNKGDCDSKSTLTAAILKFKYPEDSMIFTYMPSHAMLGMDFGNRTNGTSITIKGIRYILMEPTGPAMYSLGEIDAKNKIHIRNKQFVVEAI